QTAKLLRERTPAVVLLDLHMGRELSLSALFELRSASPATRVVILTMDDDPAFVGPAWNAGAAGYVLKEASRTDLVRAIRTVAKADEPRLSAGAARARQIEREAAQRRVIERLRATAPQPPSATKRAAVVVIATLLFAAAFTARVVINDPDALLANFYIIPVA